LGAVNFATQQIALHLLPPVNYQSVLGCGVTKAVSTARDSQFSSAIFLAAQHTPMTRIRMALADTQFRGR
jgi:hypothetical protein